jgi:GT2 family glycosyltransferase
MPTFQRREVVCDAVRSLCALNYEGEIELIVVVDGSDDGSATALRDIRCPFAFDVQEQENAGAATARNRGARAATGDILLFLDDDMMAAPDLLTQHALSHRRGADAVFGHIPLDPRSPPGLLADGVGRWADQRGQRLATTGELGLFDLLTGQLSVKRRVFEELGGFDEDFTAGGSFGNEDLDFGVRLLERHRVEFNPNAISYQRYVVSPRQLLAQWRDAGRADVRFARKHPDRAKELFDLHGARKLSHRVALKPLAAIPGAPRLLAGAALWLAERERQLPRPVRRLAARLVSKSRDVVYWAAVREEASKR